MLMPLLSFIYEEDGQGMAEYSLIMALVVLVCIAGYAALGPSVRDRVSAFAAEAYQ